jgi:hypothetical protein
MKYLNIINIKTMIIMIIIITVVNVCINIIIYLPVTIVSTVVCPWHELLETSLRRRTFLAGGMMGGSLMSFSCYCYQHIISDKSKSAQHSSTYHNEIIVDINMPVNAERAVFMTDK